MHVCKCVCTWFRVYPSRVDDRPRELVHHLTEELHARFHPGGWPLIVAQRKIDGLAVGQDRLKIGVKWPRAPPGAPGAHAVRLAVPQQTKQLGD